MESTINQKLKDNMSDVSSRDPIGKLGWTGIVVASIFGSLAGLYEAGSQVEAKDVTGGIINKGLVHTTNVIAEGTNQIASFANNAIEICNNTFGTSLGQAFETTMDVQDALVKAAYIGLALTLGSVGINALLNKANRPDQTKSKKISKPAV
jgi:hypothetical protein